MENQNENFKTEEEQEYEVTEEVTVMVSPRKVRVYVGECAVALCVVLNAEGKLEVYDWWGYGS